METNDTIEPTGDAQATAPNAPEPALNDVAELRRANAAFRHAERELQVILAVKEMERDAAKAKLDEALAEVERMRVSVAVDLVIAEYAWQVNPKTLARLIDQSEIKASALGQIDRDAIRAQVEKIKADCPELFPVRHDHSMSGDIRRSAGK